MVAISKAMLGTKTIVYVASPSETSVMSEVNEVSVIVAGDNSEASKKIVEEVAT